MRRWIALVLAALLAAWQLPSQAQARVFSQPELDALLAPVALYPDAVLSNILEAATYPDDLREAAAWSRENHELTGENALRAAEPIPWHPSVKALLAFPDLLARMDESPQWTADLGAAFRDQEPYVMDTVQALRRRAQAHGSLQSNDQYMVQQQDSSIAVYPAQPQMVYVPYYNPYVVYGPWWWPAYRPVFWRPWYTRPTVFVSSPVFFVRSVDWHRRHVVKHVAHHHRAPARHHPPAVKPIHPQHPQLQWHRHLPQQQWHQQQPRQQQIQHQTRQPTHQPPPRQQWRGERRAEMPAPRAQQPALNQAVPMRQLRHIAETARTPVPQAQVQPRQAPRQPHPHFGNRGGESRQGWRAPQNQRR
jgi:hypothetical protein